MITFSESTPELRFYPLTRDRWEDFEKLFRTYGGPGGSCWCMWWRQTTAEYQKNKGEHNRRAMKEIVESGRVPGILAYAGEQPVGWCSVGLRTEFSRLLRSPLLKPVDDEPVWSVVCLFIDRDYRKSGLSSRLLKAAALYAARQGATIIEGYPVIPKKKGTPDSELYMGLCQAFERAGFKEVKRLSAGRAIYRYYVSRKCPFLTNPPPAYPRKF
jgi:GNAT superfamily N-acetyltransferase